MWRRLLLLSLAATVLFVLPFNHDPGRTSAQATPPMTGGGVPGFSTGQLDSAVLGFLARWSVPGAALAVTFQGRLVLARGYGYADVQANQPVQPDSLFRIASVSKPITSAAIMLLYEQGKLDLDAPVFSTYLSDLTPPSGAHGDSRLQTVTIRQLLHHTGGWDRDVSYDPMFIPETVASALGVPNPPTCVSIIRYMLGQPLDFTPGQKYAYSNFGYCVLGRVIEHVTGQAYADYVTSTLLTPLGISHIAQGHTLPVDRLPGEVTYYDYPNAPLQPAVFPSVGDKVRGPYGTFFMEALDSHGGWVASAIDYVRLVAGIDGSRAPALLRPSTIRTMTERPALPVSVNDPNYYAMGWQVQPGDNYGTWWHEGDLPGTGTVAVRYSSGYTYAIFFNSLPNNSGRFQYQDVEPAMDNIFLNLASAPPGDLFTQYAASAALPHGGSVTYAAGWNLVAGGVLPAGVTSLYTLQAKDSDYETVASGAETSSGEGYWAYFAQDAAVSLPAGNSNPYSVRSPAAHWVMVGNPSGTRPATVTGADIVYTYTPDRGYASSTTLAPGAGAWALTRRTGLITVTSR